MEIVKFCSRSFSYNYIVVNFMLQGQDWVKRVGVCLQDKLIHSSVYAENSSCDQISSSSYGFHAHAMSTMDFVTLYYQIHKI